MAFAFDLWAAGKGDEKPNLFGSESVTKGLDQILGLCLFGTGRVDSPLFSLFVFLLSSPKKLNLPAAGRGESKKRYIKHNEKKQFCMPFVFLHVFLHVFYCVHAGMQAGLATTTPAPLINFTP